MNSIGRFVLVTLSCLLVGAGPETSDPQFERGNELIAKGDFPAAETVFREALVSDPENAVYRSQLALCLIQQKKHEDAEQELDHVLQRHPQDPAALWYRVQNSFRAGKYREAVARVKSVLPHLDKRSPQYYSAYWFLATSWKSLLLRSYDSVTAELQRTPTGAEMGLTQGEVDEMLEAYTRYLELQPKAEDKDDVKKFMRWVKKNRPPSNVMRWVVASPPE